MHSILPNETRLVHASNELWKSNLKEDENYLYEDPVDLIFLMACLFLNFKTQNLENKLFLDIGVGSGGIVSQFLLHMGVKLIGIDISDVALNNAKKKKIIPVNGNLMRLPFHQASFDGIVLCNLTNIQYFNSISKIQILYSDIFSLLKKGGAFVQSNFGWDRVIVDKNDEELLLEKIGFQRITWIVDEKVARIDAARVSSFFCAKL